MSVAVSGGYPQYDSTGTSKFIPEIWSGKLLVKFYAATCLTEVTNNDYEGEVKAQGDKVYIRTVPDITISDYQKGQNLTNQVPTSTPVTLTVDKAKYWSVVIDDIDKAQTDLKLMDSFTGDAAEKMKITIEKQVFGAVYADVAATNKGATAGVDSGDINLGTEAAPVQLTATNAVDKLLDLGVVMDEANLPETGRFAIIPPWFGRMLKASDLKNAQLTGDKVTPLRNGLIGEVDRMKIFVSNNLAKVVNGSSVNVWHCLAGIKDAVSFASQLTNVEALRSTTTFGNIMRGLNVYGFKTTKTDALCDLIVRK